MRSGISPIRRCGMRVVVNREPEVARRVVSRHLHYVLTTAQQLDDRQRKIREVLGIRLQLCLKKVFQTLSVRLARKAAAQRCRQCHDALPTRRNLHDSANAGKSFSVEKSGRGLIRRDHEIFNDVAGTILLAGGEIHNRAFRRHHRMQFHASETRAPRLRDGERASTARWHPAVSTAPEVPDSSRSSPAFDGPLRSRHCPAVPSSHAATAL